MAARTRPRGDIDVIKHCRCPGIAGVAVITGVAAGNVVGALAGGD